MYKLLKLEIKEKEPENAKGEEKNHQQAIIFEKAHSKQSVWKVLARVNGNRKKKKYICKSRHSNDEWHNFLYVLHVNAMYLREKICTMQQQQ